MSNPNDAWNHAGSIESKRMREDRRVELEQMKDLFLNKLPIGDNKEHIEQYFNDLEKVIYTTDDVKNDEFPTDDAQRDYRYFSASLLKERASRDPDITDGKDVANSTNAIGSTRTVQNGREESQHVPCVSEYPEPGDIDIYDQIDREGNDYDS